MRGHLGPTNPAPMTGHSTLVWCLFRFFLLLFILGWRDGIEHTIPGDSWVFRENSIGLVFIELSAVLLREQWSESYERTAISVLLEWRCFRTGRY